ncbi:hypothetical protein [Candidatus Methanodesulfokora washburnensis]|uniref:Uncharacterized protein n=1 Tax=Candidatus Methanodesulfokora washburnensis TaxID=2478471 RepID=A0A429GY32_9CREN|nr:hypothetical protein [Candidatus Methanodesulfokores washburnensis]RSN78676.1 hypothetical protein D6D85_00700 [Candidatus Methanodesulfokores washburnensis]
MKAVTWALLIIVGILLASFFLFIRPSFIAPILRDQARDIAQYVAGQISFMARMADQGVAEGQRSFRIDAGSDKLVEIVVMTNVNNGQVSPTGQVIVRVSSRIPPYSYGQASANYTSSYPVIQSTLFQGNIVISFNGTAITVANIKS